MRKLGRIFREMGVIPDAVVSSDFYGQCNLRKK